MLLGRSGRSLLRRSCSKDSNASSKSFVENDGRKTGTPPSDRFSFEGFQGLHGLHGFHGLQGSQGFRGFRGLGGRGFRGGQGLRGSRVFRGSRGARGLGDLRDLEPLRVSGISGGSGSFDFWGLKRTKDSECLNRLKGLMGSNDTKGAKSFNALQRVMDLTNPATGRRPLPHRARRRPFTPCSS